MDWQDILIGFILNGLVVLLVRAWLNDAHERDMAEIRRRNENELALVNARLDRALMIHETQFKELHQRRAIVISELYKLLAIAENKLERSKLPMPYIGDPEKSGWDIIWEKINPTYSAVTEVTEFYNQNRIFLTTEQTELMNRIIEIFDDVKHAITTREMHMYSPPEDEETKEASWEGVQAKLSMSYDEFHEIYPDLKTRLEGSFRSILGSDISA